jgi:hypothetical protein
MDLSKPERREFTGRASTDAVKSGFQAVRTGSKEF